MAAASIAAAIMSCMVHMAGCAASATLDFSDCEAQGLLQHIVNCSLTYGLVRHDA